MAKAEDPYYNRKPVPAEFIKDVGFTGLTPEEEFMNREKKYTAHGGADLRRFDMKKDAGWAPETDPYYGRKRVSDAETHGVGVTGLSAQEEHLNRERKMSVNGVDIRRFSNSATGGMAPQNDPYYGRKPVDKAETTGVGELNLTPAEAYENRERKQSLVQLSSDPFAQFSGAGHRASISDVGAAHAAAETRRRSSAAQGGAASAAVANVGKTHSGYDGDRLEPIISRPVGAESSAANSSTVAGSEHHAPPMDFHDPDSVAPHEVR